MRSVLIALCLTGIAAHPRTVFQSPFYAAVYAEWQKPAIDDPKCDSVFPARITPQDYNGNGTFTCRDGVWVPDLTHVSLHDLARARVEARFEASKWREVTVQVREGKQWLPFSWATRGALVEVECQVNDWSGLQREPGVTYILTSHTCGYTENGNSLSWGANVPYTASVRVPKQ